MTIQFRPFHGKIFKKPGQNELMALLLICLIATAVGSACHRRPPEVADNVDTADATVSGEKVAEADKLYAQREDLGKARQSVALLRQAQLSDYGNYDAAWKLARANYYVGEHSTDDRERDNSFREGIEAGKAAVKLQDGKPEGHFWLGACYGGSARDSTLAGLANIEDIRREMEAVLKIDEGFQCGSAYLGLGQLYLESPKMLGGDTQKALQYLEKGLRFGDNALLRVRLAEAYHSSNRDAEARKQLDYLASMKVPPEYEAEYKDALQEAQKLRGELKA